MLLHHKTDPKILKHIIRVHKKKQNKGASNRNNELIYMFPELQIFPTPNITCDDCISVLYHIITIVVMYKLYQYRQDILGTPGGMAYNIVCTQYI